MANDSAERTILSSQSGDHFFRHDMGRIRKGKRKASHTANGKAAPNCILLRSLRHRDLRGDQVVCLIRKLILYYPLFLLPSSLFGKEL